MEYIVSRDNVKVDKRIGSRSGKGFSKEELQKAGISIHQARSFKFPVDDRRNSAHESNVEKIKEALANRKKS